MKIYIVEGSTGEYSDRRNWNVIAYTNKQEAEDHAFNATKRAKEIFPFREDFWEYNRSEFPDRLKNEFDPRMDMDYTGTDYYVTEVELVMPMPG